MGQNQFLISIALISIFTLAILNMAIGFGNDNSTPINIGDSDFVGGVNSTAVTNAQSGFNVQNASGTSFEESSIEESSESGTLVTGSQFKDAPKSNLGTVYNVIRNAQAAIFGEDKGFNTVFTIIITLVGTISIMLIWKTWKGGNPE